MAKSAKVEKTAKLAAAQPVLSAAAPVQCALPQAGWLFTAKEPASVA